MDAKRRAKPEAYGRRREAEYARQKPLGKDERQKATGRMRKATLRRQWKTAIYTILLANQDPQWY